MDALVAQANKVIGFGGNNGGFAYDQGKEKVNQWFENSEPVGDSGV